MAKIGIVGLGLIGASMGLALKKAKFAEVQIIGYDRDPEVGQRAVKFGAVDREAFSVEDLADESALVIVATPIITVEKTFAAMAPKLHAGTVVTDTASTKANVLRWASELLPRDVYFVGGHPMAGKEQTGPQAAEATLFEGRPYCIVPAVDAHPGAVSAVMGLAEAVGAAPFFIDAQEHDAYAAAISHVPLVASVALFALARNSSAWPELAAMAGTGFRDLTRLASGSPEMAHDIFSTNRDNMRHWMDRYITELLRLRDLIEGDDSQAMFRAIAEVQIQREEYLEKPPQRPLAGADMPEVPSTQSAFFSLMAGSLWTERARELTESVENRSKERQQRERLRRRE
jgi:prephenate dehydrogenase